MPPRGSGAPVRRAERRRSGIEGASSPCYLPEPTAPAPSRTCWIQLDRRGGGATTGDDDSASPGGGSGCRSRDALELPPTGSLALESGGERGHLAAKSSPPVPLYQEASPASGLPRPTLGVSERACNGLVEDVVVVELLASPPPRPTFVHRVPRCRHPLWRPCTRPGRSLVKFSAEGECL